MVVPPWSHDVLVGWLVGSGFFLIVLFEATLTSVFPFLFGCCYFNYYSYKWLLCRQLVCFVSKTSLFLLICPWSDLFQCLLPCSGVSGVLWMLAVRSSPRKRCRVCVCVAGDSVKVTTQNRRSRSQLQLLKHQDRRLGDLREQLPNPNRCTASTRIPTFCLILRMVLWSKYQLAFCLRLMYWQWRGKTMNSHWCWNSCWLPLRKSGYLLLPETNSALHVTGQEGYCSSGEFSLGPNLVILQLQALGMTLISVYRILLLVVYR